jgi:Ca2+-binding RTX toxin-like protein
MLPSLATTDRPVPPPEPLEPRRFLSAAVVHHVLQIDGTPRSDAIVVTRGRRAVTVDVNGRVAEFSLRSFGSISVRAGKGDDTVTIGTRDNPIAIPASVSAGEGNDLVIAGNANDTIAGDDGDDEISAAGGNDVVRGGAGHDTIFGGDGDDRLSGDNHADRIFGNAGNDTVRGGRGDDELHDGLGKDAVYGEGGADHFCVAEGRKEFRDAGKGEAMTTDQESDIELTAVPGPPSRSGAATVAYGLMGDANLNGTVDFNDLVKLGGYGGDFNIDGITDFNDLVKMAQNYNSPLPSTPATSDESAHWVNFDDLFANPHAST